MICSKCGSDNQDNIRFCTSCGFQLKEGSSATSESTTINKLNASGGRIANNIFLNFIAPYLSTIDDGRFFRQPMKWLYTFIAFINIVIPFYILYLAIENRIFQAPGKFIIVFILVLITIAFTCWIGFQIWWDRKDKVDITSSSKDDFVAIPVFSHFVQTLGEWAGTWVAIVGFIFSLLATIILGQEGAYLSQGLGLWFINISATSIILMPIYGFLIIISARVFAEALRAIVSIANNTKKLTK
jgi:zinc-ribbon domain